MRTNLLYALCLLFATADPALAQARLFVSGNVFSDHKRFSGNSTESTLNVTQPGGGGGVGVQVSERWDVRTEIELGRTTTTTHPLLPPETTFQARKRNRIGAYSALVGFSPVVASRVGLTVLGGISFLNVRTEVDSVPAGLLVVPHTNIDNVAAPTVGIELPVMVGSHIAVVPTLRFHAFALRTDHTSGFAIRPGVAVRWIR